MSRAVLLLLALAAPAAAQPLRQHPKNPRLLEYAGRPTVLVTSAEHYGAVVNLDSTSSRTSTSSRATG